MVKVDCHVHSEYSKYIALTTPLLTIFGAKECYNKLEDIYRIAKSKERGMDYVAITDHDTIEGALILNDKYPDIIVGEEFEVKVNTGGHLVHLVALDINEEIHDDLSDMKKLGLKQTTDYLKKRKIFYYIAHIAHSASPEQLNPKLIEEILQYTDTLEIRNAEANPEENRLTRIIAELYGKKIVAGSDAHILDSIGRTFTVSDKAKTKEEFIQALKEGKVYVSGRHGLSTIKRTKESCIYIYNLYKDIIFHSKERDREKYQKYFLDYLTLGTATPLLLTGLPQLVLSWKYTRKQKKRALKLQDEFLRYYLDKKN